MFVVGVCKFDYQSYQNKGRLIYVRIVVTEFEERKRWGGCMNGLG